MGPITTGVVPVLVTVTGAGIPNCVKLSDDGESVTAPPVPAPAVPVTGIVTGDAPESSENSNEPLCAPAVTGVKATCTVQLTPPGSGSGHELGKVIV